jgi:hypothetical protein
VQPWIITKNGESYAALIDDARRGIADIEAGRTYGADAAIAFDDLLAELRATVIPNLARFPRIGLRCLNYPPLIGPGSAEALALLATLPAAQAGGRLLREAPGGPAREHHWRAHALDGGFSRAWHRIP